MGLRGAVAFGPLCTALFLPGRVPRSFALGSMLAGPLLVLVAGIIMGLGNKAGAPILKIFPEKSPRSRQTVIPESPRDWAASRPLIGRRYSVKVPEI